MRTYTDEDQRQVSDGRKCIDCIKYPGNMKRCEEVDRHVQSYDPICFHFRDTETSPCVPAYD